MQIASCLELRKSRSAVFSVETKREIAEGCIVYPEQGSRRIRIHLEFGISCERGGFLPIVLEESGTIRKRFLLLTEGHDIFHHV